MHSGHRDSERGNAQQKRAALAALGLTPSKSLPVYAAEKFARDAQKQGARRAD